MVQQVGQRNFQPAVMTSRPDELSLVASGINDMANGLLCRETHSRCLRTLCVAASGQRLHRKSSPSGRTAELGGQRKAGGDPV